MPWFSGTSEGSPSATAPRMSAELAFRRDRAPRRWNLVSCPRGKRHPWAGAEEGVGGKAKSDALPYHEFIRQLPTDNRRCPCCREVRPSLARIGRASTALCPRMWSRSCMCAGSKGLASARTSECPGPDGSVPSRPREGDSGQRFHEQDYRFLSDSEVRGRYPFLPDGADAYPLRGAMSLAGLLVFAVSA